MDNYKECPLGAKHESDIHHLEEKLDMSVQRLEEKIDDLKADMSEGFKSTNHNIETLAEGYKELNQRYNKAESEIDDKIDRRCDARIEQHKRDVVYKWWQKLLMWLGGILGSGASLAFILRAIASLLEKL